MGWFERERDGASYFYATFMFGEAPNRRQIQEYAGTTKASALSLAAKRAREVRDGAYTPSSKTGIVTLASYATGWGEKRTNVCADDDRSRLRDHVIPYLGEKRLNEVRPVDVRDLINLLKTKTKTPRKNQKTPPGLLSPKTIHNVYGTLSAMFRDAKFEELVASNPCGLPKKMLPARGRGGRKDIYEIHQVVALITDVRIPLDRRLVYALASLTGMRHGEVAGRRWRDWDPNTAPLGALRCEDQYDSKPLKTAHQEPRPRLIPVHPVLAKLLAEWKLSGFAMLFGRAPKPEDFIVPSRRGPAVHRTVRRTLHNLQDRDCPRLGIEALTFHRFRDSFISHCLRGGANKNVVEKITHNAIGDIMDGYTQLDWEPLCQAVLCYRISLVPPPVISLPVPASVANATTGQREQAVG
jgi:integrase